MIDFNEIKKASIFSPLSPLNVFQNNLILLQKSMSNQVLKPSHQPTMTPPRLRNVDLIIIIMTSKHQIDRLQRNKLLEIVIKMNNVVIHLHLQLYRVLQDVITDLDGQNRGEIVLQEVGDVVINDLLHLLRVELLVNFLLFFFSKTINFSTLF